MPLYLKDKLVSGTGAPGKSAYEAAKSGGYAGTEASFNQALKDVPGHIADTKNPHSVTAVQVGADVAGAANEALNSAKAYTDQIVAGVIPGDGSKESPADSDSIFIYDNADSGKPKKTLISKLVELFNNTFYTKTESDTLLQDKADTASVYTKGETYTKAETDTLLQNKAPAGFGLGGIGKRVTDMNNAQESGFYSAIGSTNLPPNVESVQYGSVLVLCSQANRVTQVYFQDVTGGTGAIAVRRLNGNDWSDWEFICPPMEMNTVYRTSERYNKNPLYKKMDSNGVIWWSTDQSTWKREAERVGSYLKSDLTIYVSTTGSDTTGDGSSGKPFRTIQHAIDIVPPVLNGKYVSINVAAGTYDEDVVITGKCASRGYRPIFINGASSKEEAVNYKVRSIYIAGTGMACVTIRGFKFTGASNGSADFCSYGDSCAYLYYCVLDSASRYGIFIGDRPYSHVCIGESTISNKTKSAIAAEFGNVVQVRRCDGTNNAVVFKSGFDHGFGGMIFDCGANTISGTVAEVKNYGGQIFK